MESDYQTVYDYFHWGKCQAGNECVLQKRAMRNKAKTFVIKVLHYIAKDIYMYMNKLEMQPFPLTQIAPQYHAVMHFPLTDRQVVHAYMGLVLYMECMCMQD